MVPLMNLGHSGNSATLSHPARTSSLTAMACGTFIELLETRGNNSVSASAVSHSESPDFEVLKAGEPRSAEGLKT